MSHLHKVKSKTNPPTKENSEDMRPSPKLKQRSQSINASPHTSTSQLSASITGKKRRYSSNGKLFLQITFGNASRFTAPIKVQIFE